jgi:hypothetical protein
MIKRGETNKINEREETIMKKNTIDYTVAEKSMHKTEGNLYHS